MSVEKDRESPPSGERRKTSVVFLLAYYGAVFVMMVVGVEGIFWYLNRSGEGTA